MTKGDVATALWTTLVHCYNQGGRTTVDLPVDDALQILCSLQANVISQVPTLQGRRALQSKIAPQVDRMLKAAEAKSHLHIASRGAGLILPS